MDFSEYDLVDDFELNEILWRSSRAWMHRYRHGAPRHRQSAGRAKVKRVETQRWPWRKHSKIFAAAASVEKTYLSGSTVERELPRMDKSLRVGVAPHS